MNEVFIEFRRVGNIVQVKATDAVTGTEASFQAPANMGQDDLKKLAVRKLNYVLKRSKQ